MRERDMRVDEHRTNGLTSCRYGDDAVAFAFAICPCHCSRTG
jgi:hypothetical protein